MSQVADKILEHQALSAEAFHTVAEDALRSRHDSGKPYSLSLVQLGSVLAIKNRILAPEYAGYIDGCLDRLRAVAIDGASVGALGPGKLCVVRQPEMSLDDA